MEGGEYVIVAMATNMSPATPTIQDLFKHDSAINSSVSFPDLNQTYYTDLVENSRIRYALVIFQLAIVILAAIGNGFLIYFILKHRRFRTNVTAYLVLNLAICDFITTVFHDPMRMADILMPFTKKDFGIDNSCFISTTYCQVKEFMAAFFAGVAFHTIVAISQERHLLVCYPLQARGWLTVSRVKKLLALIWLVSFVALLPAFVWYTFIAYIPLREANVTFCMIDIFKSYEHYHGPSYFMFIFCLYFVLPTLIITITYGKIFYVLSSRGLGIPETKDQRFVKVMSARKRLAKLMLLIAVVFIILHTPYFVTYLLVSLGYDVPNNPVFTLLVIELMSSLNSVFNPFIYSAHSKTFFQKRMVSFLGGADNESSQSGNTPRHDIGQRSDAGSAEITLTASTPSRQTSTRRKLSTPSKQYQSIVTIGNHSKKGIDV